MEIEKDEDNEKIEEEETHVMSLEDIITELRLKEMNLDSPINLNITNMKDLNLPELSWNHYNDIPKKVKLNNSGHTVILCAKWVNERPYLSGGPLVGEYIFSQLHFHWGANDMEGSEHTIDGTQYPLEMHAVHYKNCYASQEAALREKDGVTILVYFLKLQSQPNLVIQDLIDNFPLIQKASTSLKMESKPLSILVPFFLNDYFMYWGNIKTSVRHFLILWLVSRTPIGISADQLQYFRTLQDANDDPLIRNFRNIETFKQKAVYHVNCSQCKYSTLLPIPREETVKQRRHIEEI